MPFTFCHPAIILPLTKISKNKISATGLVIGSMAPDFEYFIKMKMEKIHGHTFEGILYFTLPLTILLSIIYHKFVRDHLINSLPEFLNHKVLCYVGIDWFTWLKKYWYVLIYSSLIGVLSHLLWDNFTHPHTFMVNHIPILKGWINVFGVVMSRTDFLQALSTLIGGVIILATLIIPKQNQYNHKQFKTKIKYWAFICLITIIILFVRNIQSLGDFIATLISGGLIGLIVTPYFLEKLKI
ncbi:DUF4184 family protein [Crocinitomix algicola]|uniref:DUF4184 family protein n=1 Tax=Crocinitomix algicola TaxID=1740263 RepID=UPI0008343F7C|nr:DUF4184 family protein [Crocinitomix algicola]